MKDRTFVIATAGHIDHGKSVLVRALTGIDPDRLREEKERGMTIDLGFAWMKLPGGTELGIVDVPGHESFIRNMVAGVGGIAAALLVVDATEGVMPQTREHFGILTLLEIPRLVVALTKKDLVDDEFLEVARADVAELLQDGGMSDAPIVAVSAVTRDGLRELADVLERVLCTTAPQPDRGQPRMWIDRSFSIAGAGTVVTGTLLDGHLKVGDQVEVLPAGFTARVRTLQTHKERVSVAVPGSRVGVNLVGVSRDELGRGDLLVGPGWLAPTGLASARCRLLPEAPGALRHNVTVNLHAGTAQTSARVRLLDREELLPGEDGLVQVVLARSLPLVTGDHFVLRSPKYTLGGGRILEPHARRYRRFRVAAVRALRAIESGSPEDLILAALQMRQPLGLHALARQTGLTSPELKAALEALHRRNVVVVLGRGDQQLIVTVDGWNGIAGRAVSILREYHRTHPTRAGMPRTELGSRLGVEQQATDVLVRLVQEGWMEEERALLRLPGHSVSLTSKQQEEVDAFLRSLEEQPYSPPTGRLPAPDLLMLLVDRRQVVRVGDLYFAAPAYDAMVEAVKGRLEESGKITAAEVRDMFGTSRKYAVSFLEHLDSIKLTRRVGDQRVLF